MQIERGRAGGWVVYAIVGGYLMRRTYFGYTATEAVKAFRAEAKRQEV